MHHRAGRFIQATAVLLCGLGAGLLMASVLAGGGARQTGTHGPVPFAGDQPLAPKGNPVGGPASQLLGPAAKASFDQLAASFSGHLQLALTPVELGPGVVLGGNGPSAGLGTMRAVVLAALLRERGPRGFSKSESARARAAITRARQPAVLALVTELERDLGGLDRASRYIKDLLRASGDRGAVVSAAPSSGGPSFGLTALTPSASLKFFRALGRRCLLDRSRTRYLLQLMRETVPSQRWGLGSTRSSLRATFTSGWGPQPDGSYLVRQSGIIGTGSAAVAVAIVAHPPGGGAPAFAVGRSMATTTARWLSLKLHAPIPAPPVTRGSPLDPRGAVLGCFAPRP